MHDGPVNPARGVTRTAPAIDPRATAEFVDRPSQPIRGAGRWTRHDDPVPDTSYDLTFFTLGLVARSGSDLRVLALGSEPYVSS